MARSVDPRVLWDISHGLYIVSSHLDGRLNGQIADAIVQVSFRPPMVALALNKNNLTHEFIAASKVFSVSILSEDASMDMIEHFGLRSGRDLEKYRDIEHHIGSLGCPITSGFSLGCMEVEVMNTVDAGTHTLFLGEVLFSRKIGEGRPLTYGEYRRRKTMKKGERVNKDDVDVPAEPTLDTNILVDSNIEEEKDMTDMDKYVCTACGYIYDPAKGDPDGGIDPGTSFADIPSDWVCPLCGVGKEFFEKVQ